MPESTRPGPFSTEREAEAFAWEFGGPPSEGWHILSDAQNHQMLLKACELAGVSLGAYDRRILPWLAEWEDTACAVVAALIIRASKDPGRCAVCRIPSSGAELYWCHPHGRWECVNRPACVDRLRQADARKEADDGSTE